MLSSSGSPREKDGRPDDEGGRKEIAPRSEIAKLFIIINTKDVYCLRNMNVSVIACCSVKRGLIGFVCRMGI